MPTYYRLHQGDEDPQELLEPENQQSEPWGAPDVGQPCDKCGGTGRTTYHCDGRPEFEGECPACKGSGKITDHKRNGVSVFPAVDSLYRYMIRKGADLSGCTLVALEGEETDDVDFDADEGVLLVRPTRIVGAEPVDQDRVGELSREAGRS